MQHDRFSAHGEAQAMLADILTAQSRDDLLRLYEDWVCYCPSTGVPTLKLAADLHAHVRSYCAKSGIDYNTF